MPGQDFGLRTEIWKRAEARTFGANQLFNLMKNQSYPRVLAFATAAALGFAGIASAAEKAAGDKPAASASEKSGGKEKSSLSGGEKSFLKNAAEGGLAEVQFGQLGKSKGGEDVKQMAEHIVTDHTKANEELAALAQSKGVELPKEPGMVAKGKLKLLEKSDKFDKAWIDHAVSDHKEDIKKFEKASQDAKDPDVKAFADKTLPVLKHHLQMAEEAQKKTAK